MYNKDLTEDLRLRLNRLDFDFLVALSSERNCSVSSVLRSIIGEYRRCFVQRGLSNGDTLSNIDNILQ